MQLQSDAQMQRCYAGARVEEFVYEKVQGSKPQRMLENDVLGQHMIDAGNDFGPGTAYGQFLGLFLVGFPWVFLTMLTLWEKSRSRFCYVYLALILVRKFWSWF